MQELMKLGSALGWCFLLVSLAALPSGYADKVEDSLVGYDCASNILPLLVERVFQSPPVNKTTMTIEAQLIHERRERMKIEVSTCRVERRREVHRHHLTEPVSVVTSKYKVGKAECEQMHATGKLTLGDDLIDVTQNVTTVKVLIKAGEMQDDGSWIGGEYIHEGEKYSNVLVTETVTIDMGKRYPKFRPEMAAMMLKSTSEPSGYDWNVDYSAGYYFDRDTSTTLVWDVVSTDVCMSDWYEVLYEGPINLLKFITDHRNTTFFLVPDEEQVIALKPYQGTPSEMCGFNKWSINDDLLIVEKDKNLGYMVQSSEKIPNIDYGSPFNLAGYIKRKSLFQAASHERKMNVTHRFIDPFRSKILLLWEYTNSRVVVVQPCPTDPTVGKPHLGEGGSSHQGYVLKCMKVPVAPRKAEICNPLQPVNYNGEPWFLVKESSLLIKSATDCPKA